MFLSRKHDPTRGDDSYIVISDLTKTYPLLNNSGRLHVLDKINLRVKKGEFVTFFGPNGCGKTTLLYTLAGLVDFDEGIVRIGGREPGQANIGFIFQNYADSLFPWKKNIANISYPLELRGISPKESHEKARDFVAGLDLEIDMNSYPYQLSGGQQQLLAVVRALVYEPDVLLMDEPFSSLDYQTRVFMQEKILDIWQKTSATILFVSHEIDEAILLATRVALLSKRPASIKQILIDDLPRPRLHKMLTQDDFLELRRKALMVFEEEIAA